MSFDLDQDQYDKAPAPFACPACYPIGETPNTVFLTFSDIKIGTTWNPGDPPPANGIHQLTSSAACEWSATIDGIDYLYKVVGAVTTISAKGGPLFTHFTGTRPAACRAWCFNSNNLPGGKKYYDGNATLTNPIEFGAYSAVALLELLGETPSDEWLMKPIPDIDTNVDSVLTRFRDKSHIHIQHGFPI